MKNLLHFIILMGLFDSDFKIDNYIRNRIPQLDNLENRELFKRIVGNLTVDLYNHIKDESPKVTRLPNLITCVISKDSYDLTYNNFFLCSPRI